MYVYCVNPVMSRNRKKGKIVLRRAQTGVVLFVLMGVLYHVRPNTVADSFYMNNVPGNRY
jgi:hypothetical protein